MATRHEGGFTLLELLVVVSIVGILASIAIPQYASYRARGFDSIVESQVRHVATGEEAYFASNSTYSNDINSLDGMVLEEDVEITISAGNSGDIASSFRIHGLHPQASHEYDWVSDPLPGEPNLVISD
ncbi:MAG: prepilin-type N-terminal cleavage/methylation domain-containing protein [Deltaproteobacteria bacterium]|nr:prepilin-type N-terminal cleavage/methylation domain-containing protein [Deltaproteobacteria bacterium]